MSEAKGYFCKNDFALVFFGHATEEMVKEGLCGKCFRNSKSMGFRLLNRLTRE